MSIKDDLISREALKKELNSRPFPQDYSTTLLLGVFNELIVNAQVVFERPQGVWIETSDFDEFYGKVYKCTNCNKETLGCSCHNYCPNCGADMRGKEE